MIENNKLIKFSVSRKEEVLQRKNNVICKDSEELEKIIRRSFNQKDEKARQEQLEAILNVDKDELLEIAKEIDETLEKGGICIIGGKNQINQCDLDEVISL